MQLIIYRLHRLHQNHGWGVTEIERDLPLLTREEIEAAIQYYLNHRAEIEQDLRRSRAQYEANAPKPELLPI